MSPLKHGGLCFLPVIWVRVGVGLPPCDQLVNSCGCRVINAVSRLWQIDCKYLHICTELNKEPLVLSSVFFTNSTSLAKCNANVKICGSCFITNETLNFSRNNHLSFAYKNLAFCFCSSAAQVCRSRCMRISTNKVVLRSISVRNFMRLKHLFYNRHFELNFRTLFA